MIKAEYDLVIFDLDGTLTPSKQAMPTAMALGFADLLEAKQVAVISGGHYEQFQKQLLSPLEIAVAGKDASKETGDIPATKASDEETVGSASGSSLDSAVVLASGTSADGPEGRSNALPSPRYQKLHLLPTCGTQYFRYLDGQWRCQYRKDLDPQLAQKAKQALKQVCKQLGYWCAQPVGERIEDRGSQLTFSALGQDAPLERKAAWDPDGHKRIAIAQRVQKLLPELTVRSGGSTSVDVTMRGVDKAYGINHLLQLTKIARGRALFIGDRLDKDGNDYPAISTGIEIRATSGWEETLQIVRELVR